MEGSYVLSSPQEKKSTDQEEHPTVVRTVRISEDTPIVIERNYYGTEDHLAAVSLDSNLQATEPNNNEINTAGSSSTKDLSNSFNFSGGSFITRSMIEPELETYFKTNSTWLSGVLIMANVCLGMGILNFPRIVYESGGIVITMTVLAVFVALIMGSLYITAYCCRHFGAVNYQDMVRLHCGPRIGVVCSILMFLEVTGSLTVKMVVLQDQLDRFYSLATKPTHLSRQWYLMPAVAIVAFLPMCFIRQFRLFKYASLFGIVAAVYIAFGVALTSYFLEGPADPLLFVETSKHPRDFNLLLPLLVYGFHGHIEAPLVFAGLRQQRLRVFMKTVYCYTLIAAVCYAVTAVSAYLTFGRDTDPDFLLNYPDSSILAAVANAIVCFKLFTSFPVLFFVDRSVFSGFYTTLVRKLPRNSCRQWLEHYSVARTIQTFVIFTLVVLLAALIPNISNAISIIGAISCHFSFTFPGLCFLFLYEKAEWRQRKYFLRKVIGMGYVVLGTFLFGANTCVTIQTLMKGGTVA